MGRSAPVALAPLDAARAAGLPAAARAWIPTGVAGADGPELEGAELEGAEEIPALVLAPDPGDPHWPIASAAPVRLLAWPPWEEPRSLRDVAACLRPLRGRVAVCLVLCRDPGRDAEAGAGLEALAEALATQEAAGPPVEVVLETAPGSQEGWERIGRSVDAVVWPGTPAAGREELVALKHTTLRSPAEASAWLASHQRSARPELPVLQLEELRHA